MDVLSTVANFNTPVPKKAVRPSSGDVQVKQNSDSPRQDKEFSSYLNKENSQSNNYNVKTKEQKSDNTNIQVKNSEEEKKQPVDYAGAAAVQATNPEQTSKMTDDSEAVTTLQEHINKIEKNKTEFIDPLRKRAAIQDFVHKMKTSFDIEPTEIVQSFANLSVEELGMPPEKTMGKVLDHLPLDQSEKQQAQLFFSNMLNKTEANSMAEYIHSSGRELSLKDLSDEQMRKQELDKSLVKLNESFFTPLKTSEPVIPELQGLHAKTADQSITSNQFDSKYMSLGQGNLSSELHSPKRLEEIVTVPNSGGNFVAQNFEGEKLELSNYSVYDQQSLEEISKNVDSVDQDIDFKKPEPQILDINKLAIDRQLQAKQVVGKTDTSSDMESFSQDNLEPQVDISRSINTEAQALKVQDNKVFQTLMNQNNVSEVDVEQNINKIIQSSQTMIKDGGGEMKIQMTPEGLGEINLKVMVEDGNVNIELLADNKDTKKLMEKGLLDLKANLATHKLNIEGIKVEVVDQLQNQMQQEFQNQEREFARQFMQDFRQNNQGFREQFFGGFASNYKSQTEDEADNAHLRNQSSNKKSSSNRRLDLVA